MPVDTSKKLLLFFRPEKRSSTHAVCIEALNICGVDVAIDHITTSPGEMESILRDLWFNTMGVVVHDYTRLIVERLHIVYNQLIEATP
jgi:hypothetical protein